MTHFRRVAYRETQSSADADLRVAFSLLRESDARDTGAFSSAWLAATRRAAANPAPTQVKHWQVKHWQTKHWLIGVLATLLIAAVVLGRSVVHDRGGVRAQASKEPRRSVISLAQATRQTSISDWRAPSDVLLATSDRELWRSVPQLGETPNMDWNALNP